MNTAQDVFPSATDPNRVLAITAVTLDGGELMYQVRSSSDGGTTFPDVLYTAPSGDHLTGVEISRSSPSTIYLTLTSGTSYVPGMAQSTDNGATWTVHSLATSLATGTYGIRLVEVDPTNPQRVFLRVSSAAGDALAVTADGGATATSPLSFPAGAFNAYTHMASGTIIAGGVVGTSNVAYRSTDDGATFQALPAALAFRGLSSRGTTLYAASDNVSDGWAIETSPDEGMTWQPVMRYDQNPGHPDLRLRRLPDGLPGPRRHGAVVVGHVRGLGDGGADRRRRRRRTGRRYAHRRQQRQQRHGRPVRRGPRRRGHRWVGRRERLERRLQVRPGRR